MFSFPVKKIEPDFLRVIPRGDVKPESHPEGWLSSWRAVASFLFLEEGCHSAGFITTIHLRHHLLLSIGLRFNLFAPE